MAKKKRVLPKPIKAWAPHGRLSAGEIYAFKWEAEFGGKQAIRIEIRPIPTRHTKGKK